ncbi:DegT/DnrJ/EryC1/StrS family aminotransferase [Maridesulfovibrio sp.]|uniref:DegT/DnrJ/EryC1/StrS family aminotransferase n=1 Tax=Maridesulfovibrio sp. TaxID=2795000 RepID=UPI0029CA89DA|nr:DegT/DnrJ/EryC1/StrS family aminotransferase [Maridesulfovibrio sp.]
MDIRSPQPRFRINSRVSDYFSVAKYLAKQKLEINHDDWHNLERYVEELTGAKHAICMPQARVGIHLAICEAVQPGKEVILSPNTIADVINMVVSAGAVPVFCDIDPVTGNLDPATAETLITDKTAAIMCTHLYGLVAPMAELQALAEKHGLALIEDSAQAFGARYDGKYAGAIGDFGVFSFGMAKNVTAFFGGMVLVKEDAAAESIRARIAQFPVMDRTKFGKKALSCFIKDTATMDIVFSQMLFPLFRMAYRKDIRALTSLMETELDLSLKSNFPESYKARMTPVQARLILKKMDKLESDYEHRLQCARIYHEGLQDLPNLKIPPLLEDGSHVYNYYPVQHSDRVGLRAFMMETRRDAALQHIKNTADLPAFQNWYRDCPNCREWAAQTIMLPNYAKYRFSEVEKNVEAIRKFCEQSA